MAARVAIAEILIRKTKTAVSTTPPSRQMRSRSNRTTPQESGNDCAWLRFRKRRRNLTFTKKSSALFMLEL